MTTGENTDRQAAQKAAMLEEIRREMQTMTEPQRMEYLLELREIFRREKKEKLGVRY